MSDKLKIGDIEAEAGTKKSSYIKVSDLNGYVLQLPLMIINGLKNGPTLCLTAGIHACEYAGIETIMRLFAQLNPKELSGAILAVPVVNIPAFQTRSAYVNPIDGLNLNRVFPGKTDGTLSHMIAHTLFNKVTLKANYLIDFHGGDIPEENIDFVIVEKTGNEKVDEASAALGKAFNPEYMWVKTAAARAGLQIEGSQGTAAVRAGIPAAVPEAGNSGKVQESAVNFLLNGTLNIMKYLRMLEGSPVMGEPKIIKAQHVVKTRSAGFFRPSKNLGEVVSRGEVIGHIRDVFGEVIEKVTSPVYGVFDFLYFHASVLPGSSLMIIGEL